MGILSSIGDAVSGVVGGVSKAVSGVVKGVKGAINKVAKLFGEVSSFLGPVGTIALLAFGGYMAYQALATYTAAGATAGQVAAVQSAGATAASSVSAGASLSVGVGEAAALGGASAETLFASTALGETAVAGAAVAETSLGLGVTLAPYVPELGAFSAEAALATTATTGANALGYVPQDLYASEALGETGYSEGFDWKEAGKKAASLLGGGEPPTGGYESYQPAIPGLTGNTSNRGLTSASGGNVGLSNFIREAQPGLTSGILQQSDHYKSLLAKGY